MNPTDHDADEVAHRVQLGEVELAAGAGTFYENVDTLLAGLNG